MLDMDKVREVLGHALKDAMSGSVVELQVSPAVSWTGEPMLSVLLVLRDWFEDRIGERSFGDAIFDAQEALQLAGEERFAVLRFATESEMAELALVDDDDPEA